MKKPKLTEHYKRQFDRVLNYLNFDSLPDAVKEQLSNLKAGMHKVCVLYYGGTIGMVRDAQNRLVPTNDINALLKPLYVKGLDKEVQVVWFQVYPGKAIDSTNGRWFHWVTIGNAIRLLYDLFDGFVVVGGTDTMAHMIASMNYMFPNVGKPIIATGAQLPIWELGDDATRNLYFSIAAALSDLSGGHLAFADILIHGLHAFKTKDRGFAAFSCPSRYQIGEFNGTVDLFDSAPSRRDFVNQKRLDFVPRFREGIDVMEISPASPSNSILHTGTNDYASSLLIITFGAGNVRNEPSYEGEMTHVDAIRILNSQGFPVILGSPMADGKVDSPYAPGVEALSKEVGGISGGDTCGPSLHVKAMKCFDLAWNADAQELDPVIFRREMQRNHVGELSTTVKPGQ